MTRPLILGVAFAALVSSPLVADAGHFGGGGGAHFGGGGHFGGHAGGFHVGGGFHAGGGVRGGGVRGGIHFGRSRYGGGYGGHYGWGVRGHYRGWGYGGWYRPYWYSPGYYPYYYGSYYPLDGSYVSGPGAVEAAPPIIARPPLPRFGIGVYGGLAATNNSSDDMRGTDVGLLARIRIGGGLLVEGEIGKESDSVQGQSDGRVDRRYGGSLIYEFGVRHALAPYVLAGLGVETSNTDASSNATQDYGELGVGLRYALTPHIAITADIRAGARGTLSSNASGDTARSSGAPPAQGTGSEDYTRGRLAAIIYF